MGDQYVNKQAYGDSYNSLLDEAWSHNYTCACDTCLSAWALLGPDGGTPGEYGPFTKSQINERQRKMSLEETP